MNKFTKSLSIYLLPVLGLIFYSCIDDPVSPDGNIVTCTLYDKYDKRYASRFDEFFISFGNAPLYYIAGTPEFTLNSFSTPYDFVINEFFGNKIFKYEGISINNIKPVFISPYDNERPEWPQYKDFIVRLPFSEYTRSFYLKVISEDRFYQERYKYYLGPGDTIVALWFEYPAGIEKFSGKIMYLQEEITGNYQLEFTGYGIKSLEEAVNDRIEFTEDDISYDPPEVTKTFRNTVPGESFEYRSKASLNFAGCDNGSDLVLYEGLRDGDQFTMPLLPLSNLNYKYVGGYQTGAYFGFAFKEVILNPADEMNIIHKTPLSIISPEANAVNITGNSVFKITDDNSPGVYMYEFVVMREGALYRYLRYYTAKKELKFSDITCRGFEMQPNSEYKWWVYKLPGFTNIDELLAVHYLRDSRYNDLELSENRTFNTGP